MGPISEPPTSNFGSSPVVPAVVPAEADAPVVPALALSELESLAPLVAVPAESVPLVVVSVSEPLAAVLLKGLPPSSPPQPVASSSAGKKVRTRGRRQCVSIDVCRRYAREKQSSCKLVHLDLKVLGKQYLNPAREGTNDKQKYKNNKTPPKTG